MEHQISYNRKAEYLSLIEKYIAETIDAIIFRFKFLKIRKDDDETVKILEKDFKQLSTFSIDSEADGFIDLIEQIFNE